MSHEEKSQMQHYFVSVLPQFMSLGITGDCRHGGGGACVLCSVTSGQVNRILSSADRCLNLCKFASRRE